MENGKEKLFLSHLYKATQGRQETICLNPALATKQFWDRLSSVAMSLDPWWLWLPSFIAK
jgi:hypothetical protein